MEKPAKKDWRGIDSFPFFIRGKTKYFHSNKTPAKLRICQHTTIPKPKSKLLPNIVSVIIKRLSNRGKYNKQMRNIAAIGLIFGKLTNANRKAIAKAASIATRLIRFVDIWHSLSTHYSSIRLSYSHKPVKKALFFLDAYFWFFRLFTVEWERWERK